MFLPAKIGLIRDKTKQKRKNIWISPKNVVYMHPNDFPVASVFIKENNYFYLGNQLKPFGNLTVILG